MSDRPVILLIEDILESCLKIEKYISGLEYSDFDSDSMVRDAVERNIEIIGEACNKIPDEFMEQNTGIDWHKPIAMRNRLIHGYFATDPVLLWNTTTVIIPKFKNQIQDLINKYGK
jgi:uncharacterized protein with HEPN domain